MKLRFIQSIAGISWSAKPGDVFDIPAEEKPERLIEAGIAVAAETAPVEVATIAAPETADVKKLTARKGK